MSEITEELKKDILSEAREHYKIARDADHDERELIVDDLNFLDGDQWPESIKAERKAAERPYMTINDLPKYVDQVIGEHLQNRPGITVKPHDNEAEETIANILTGMIRHIESQSTAKVGYGTGFKSSSSCGRGFWRVQTQYADPMSFNQEIVIKAIKNQLSVLWDPTAQEHDLSDAKWMFVIDEISKSDFEDRYPTAQKIDFEDTEVEIDYNWRTENKIKIAEYWRVIETEKTIYLLSDGSTTEDEKYKDKAVKKRKTIAREIEFYKLAGGTDILEGPIKWPGKYIPIVVVWGKELNIGNQTKHRGVVRFAKGPTQMYNYWRTTSAEIVAQAPRNPYVGPAGMFKDWEHLWDKANNPNQPWLPFNPVAGYTGGPKREQPPTIPTGAINECEIASKEKQDTIGIYEANVGERSNEKSGEAIKQRRSGADRGNYEYSNNFVNALIFTGKVIIDLIPLIYDTKRSVTIRNEDGTDENKWVNSIFNYDTQQAMEYGKYFNNLKKGKYEIDVNVGPSYTTQRMEAADGIMEFLRAFPAAAPVIGDIVVEIQDWKDADRIAKRLKALLPPEVKAVDEALEKGEENIPIEPPAPEPDPGADIQLQQEEAKLEGMELENSQKELELQANIEMSGGV